MSLLLIGSFSIQQDVTYIYNNKIHYSETFESQCYILKIIRKFYIVIETSFIVVLSSQSTRDFQQCKIYENLIKINFVKFPDKIKYSEYTKGSEKVNVR